MTTTYDDLIADQMATFCEANHFEHDTDCAHCEIRATWQHCFNCGAEWEDGQPTKTSDDHEHVLMSDWDEELTCGVLGRYPLPWAPGEETTEVTERCGDPVTTPGKTACDFHSREADAVEADRIYRSLVAVR